MNSKKAISKYVRISPRKARLAADLIRGLPVQDAVTQLEYSRLKAGLLLKKTLDSAVANAETQLEVSKNNLRVLEVRIDAAPSWKRAKSKNRGGRAPILKRNSHLTVVVGAK